MEPDQGSTISESQAAPPIPLPAQGNDSYNPLFLSLSCSCPNSLYLLDQGVVTAIEGEKGQGGEGEVCAQHSTHNVCVLNKSLGVCACTHRVWCV